MRKIKRVILFMVRYVYALVSCLYLFIFGFLFIKNRSFLFTICEHFGGYIKRAPKVVFQTGIPEVRVSEVVPENDSIQISELNVVNGNVSLLELVIINKLVKHYKPVNIFEIGTFDGRTTLNIATNCSPEAKVYTLDLPKDNMDSTKFQLYAGDELFIGKKTADLRYLNTDYRKKITELYGDSAIFDFSPFFDKIDFIFIDGAHSYEYVLNDTKKALRLLRDKKGIILWHDFDWCPGVRMALNELYLNNDIFKNIKYIKGTALAYLILK